MPRGPRADRLVDIVRAMAIAPALATVLALGLGFLRPEALATATPWLVLWLVSPLFAWWISRPAAREAAELTNDQTEFLNDLAGKTWRFFETFVGPEDHWLPPDNFQEHPVAVIAHRTSPTNIGLALLANLAAYDFGYISADGLIERTSRTLETMERLERYQGHLFNWYDTLTLRPLPPRYVSTVDSGNLAGHLLCLRAGLDELPDRPILPPRAIDGALDDRARFDRCRRKRRSGARSRSCLSRHGVTYQWAAERARISFRWAFAPSVAGAWALAAELAGGLGTSPDEDVAWWARALDRQCRDHLTTLNLLAPWLLLPPSDVPNGCGGSRSG